MKPSMYRNSDDVIVTIVVKTGLCVSNAVIVEINMCFI